MSVLNYILLNGVLGITLYFGLFQGIQGALNIALFIIWLTVIVGMFGFNTAIIDAIKDSARKAKEPVKSLIPRWIDITFDCCVLGALVYFGWFVTGAFYILHMIGLNNAKQAIIEVNKERENV